MKNKLKEYLGDSVYVDLDSWGAIVLTTENGFGPTNIIVLEPEVRVALEDFIRRNLVKVGV